MAAAFLIIWSNVAVGIIGGKGNPANAMFAGVLLVAATGAIVARPLAAGMARTMIATAAAQLAAATVALVGRWGADSPLWPRDILAVTGFFTALWLIAAALFVKAARG